MIQGRLQGACVILKRDVVRSEPFLNEIGKLHSEMTSHTRQFNEENILQLANRLLVGLIVNTKQNNCKP